VREKRQKVQEVQESPQGARTGMNVQFAMGSTGSESMACMISQEFVMQLIAAGKDKTTQRASSQGHAAQ